LSSPTSRVIPPKCARFICAPFSDLLPDLNNITNGSPTALQHTLRASVHRPVHCCQSESQPCCNELPLPFQSCLLPPPESISSSRPSTRQRLFHLKTIHTTIQACFYSIIVYTMGIAFSINFLFPYTNWFNTLRVFESRNRNEKEVEINNSYKEKIWLKNYISEDYHTPLQKML
jgi:hypothetical protein